MRPRRCPPQGSPSSFRRSPHGSARSIHECTCARGVTLPGACHPYRVSHERRLTAFQTRWVRALSGVSERALRHWRDGTATKRTAARVETALEQTLRIEQEIDRAQPGEAVRVTIEVQS